MTDTQFIRAGIGLDDPNEALVASVAPLPINANAALWVGWYWTPKEQVSLGVELNKFTTDWSASGLASATSVRFVGSADF